jgi:hypothetical protein
MPTVVASPLQPLGKIPKPIAISTLLAACICGRIQVRQTGLLFLRLSQATTFSLPFLHKGTHWFQWVLFLAQCG